jgi:hypothetical protein
MFPSKIKNKFLIPAFFFPEAVFTALAVDQKQDWQEIALGEAFPANLPLIGNGIRAIRSL